MALLFGFLTISTGLIGGILIIITIIGALAFILPFAIPPIIKFVMWIIARKDKVPEEEDKASFVQMYPHRRIIGIRKPVKKKIRMMRIVY
jgi:hypothetical protein